MDTNERSSKNWAEKIPIKPIIIFILLFLIGLLVANLSGEYCRPCFIKNLGITETNQLCNPGVLIVRLGYAIGGVIASLVAVAALERVRALDQGNIEDRYKNAITQLGNENSSVRLGGAYGLYYLAIDNEDRRRNICNVLCVHIREITTSEVAVGKNSDGKEIKYSEKYKTNPSNEVQSILDLLTNKENNKDFPFKSHWINLANAYLNGANLWKAQLQGANLGSAQLLGVNLYSAQLQEAILWKVQLQGAILWKSQLQGATLDESQLQGAHLKEAQFQGASLIQAEFQGAKLEKAQLQGANLIQSQLQGANLIQAQLQGANLGNAQLQGADLREAQLQGADLYEAGFQGANLSSAQFQATNLYRAQLQSDESAAINFSGAYADPNSSINIPPKTNLELAVDRLKNRSGKKADLKDVVFSGGVKANNLNNFKSYRTEIEKILTGINYDHINNFKERMNRVEEILEENLGEPKNTPIPSEAITGIYPEAEADKVIAMLEEVKEMLEKQQKFFKNL